MATLPLPQQGDPAPTAYAGPAWLALGFRPFFAVATAWAALASAAWVASLAGFALPLRPPHGMVWWHAHELVFGFALAVVAGFLLTASRNWTGRQTAQGWKLAGLVALWALGRVAAAGGLPLGHASLAVVAAAFPLAVAAEVGRVVAAANSRRNMGIVVVVAAFAALELWGMLGGAEAPLAAVRAAVFLLALLCAVIGGRVIPLFTRNATGDDSIHTVPVLDRVAIGLSAACAVAAVAAPGSAVFAGVAIVAGATHLVRMRTWGSRAALAEPMLWVLHMGYAWLGAGYVLVGAAGWWPALTASTALHGLTIGTVGVLIAGMVARVSLGHTGRPIRATRLVATAFVAVGAAAVVRLSVVVAAVPPLWAWVAAGGLFSGAFAALFAVLLPVWTTPRPDGRPG